MFNLLFLISLYSCVFLSKVLFLFHSKIRKRPHSILYLENFPIENAGYQYRAQKWSEILNKNGFDVIFIDGLHTAQQVDRDIQNALNYIKKDGFIVLHDCNPPTEWHAREEHHYRISPAMNNWNGTTWKAFVKYRVNTNLYSCCIDSDWGIGVISKTKQLGNANYIENEFYEFSVLDSNRKEVLNLLSFDEFKNLLSY